MYYDRPHRLERCLTSLTCVPEKSRNVILVDNSENRIAGLNHRFPWLTVISNERNVGFAAACNAAARRATTPYLLFLNPDTEVNFPAIAALHQHLASHPEAHLVSVRLATRCGLDEDQEARFPSLLGRVKAEKLAQPILSRTTSFHQVRGWLKGACFALRTQEFNRIGGFDERFFLYGEDMDLCYRIHAGGGEIHLLDHVSIFHAGVHSWPLARRLQVGESLLRFVALHRNPVCYIIAGLTYLIRILPAWLVEHFFRVEPTIRLALIFSSITRTIGLLSKR